MWMLSCFLRRAYEFYYLLGASIEADDILDISLSIPLISLVFFRHYYSFVFFISLIWSYCFM